MKIIKLYETAKDTSSRVQEIKPEERIQKDKSNLACAITLDPSRLYQEFDGFGGALTESSGYVLSLIPAKKRKEVIKTSKRPLSSLV